MITIEEEIAVLEGKGNRVKLSGFESLLFFGSVLYVYYFGKDVKVPFEEPFVELKKKKKGFEVFVKKGDVEFSFEESFETAFSLFEEFVLSRSRLVRVPGVFAFEGISRRFFVYQCDKLHELSREEMIYLYNVLSTVFTFEDKECISLLMYKEGDVFFRFSFSVLSPSFTFAVRISSCHSSGFVFASLPILLAIRFILSLFI